MNKFYFQFIAPNLNYKNCRSYLTTYSWDKVRKTAVKKAKKCCICGITSKEARKALQCHEVFDLNRITKVQKLTGFMVVCELCHNAIHYSRTQHIAARKKTVMHISDVLGVNPDIFLDMYKKHRQKYIYVFTENTEFSLNLDYLGKFALKNKLVLHTPLTDKLDSKYNACMVYGVDRSVMKFYKTYE